MFWRGVRSSGVTDAVTGGGVPAQPGLGGAWFPAQPPFLFCTSFVWWAQLSPLRLGQVTGGFSMP